MKIGLISITSRASDAPENLLAAVSFAGTSIAERQLEFALSLGCERIVCIAHSFEKWVSKLQRRADADGVKFNAVAGPRALLGLVGAADQLIVIAEGLLPDVEIADSALGGGEGVLVFPVEAGIAAGFERIDLNYAWAGILSMQGRLVERLSQLPPDCDAISALLRIALQGRVPERTVPENALAERRWVLFGSNGQLGEIEAEWLRSHVTPSGSFSPGRSLAVLLIRRFGPRLLEKGWSGVALDLVSVGLALVGLGTAWFGPAIAGILLCGFAWLFAEGGRALGALSRAGKAGAKSRNWARSAAFAVVDISIWAVLSVALLGNAEDRLFAPFVMLAVLHLSGRAITPKWAGIAQDRLILVVLLALAIAFGELLFAIEVLTSAILAALLYFSRGQTRITQT